MYSIFIISFSFILLLLVDTSVIQHFYVLYFYENVKVGLQNRIYYNGMTMVKLYLVVIQGEGTFFLIMKLQTF